MKTSMLGPGSALIWICAGCATPPTEASAPSDPPPTIATQLQAASPSTWILPEPIDPDPGDPADPEDPEDPEGPEDPDDPGVPAPFSMEELVVGSGGSQGAVPALLAIGAPAPPAPGPTSACQAATVLPISPPQTLTWVASPPRFDLGSGSQGRPAELLLLDGLGCVGSVALSPSDSALLSTGFGTASPTNPSLVAPAGLMLRLVEVSTDLLLYSNAGWDAWRYQPATGTLVRFDPFSRVVAGAASAGTTAWVALADNGTDPAQLVRADRLGTILDGPFDLPFAPFSTGFGKIVGTGVVSMFRSHDITVGSDGRVWIIDSGNSELAVFDPATATFTSYSLGVDYPSSVRWWDGDLVLVSGLVFGSGAAAAPELWTFDESTGVLTSLGAVPAPQSWGWNTTSGFARPGLYGGMQMMQVWFDLEPVAGGLVLSDPANDRLLATP